MLTLKKTSFFVKFRLEGFCLSTTWFLIEGMFFVVVLKLIYFCAVYGFFLSPDVGFLNACRPVSSWANTLVLEVF